MTKKDFAEWHKIAKETLLKSGQHLAQLNVIFTNGQATFILMADMPSTSDERQEAMKKAGLAIADKTKQRIQEVYFVTEMWMGTDKRDSRGEIIAPSQQEGRKEGLIIVGMDVASNIITAEMSEIIRNEKGKIIDLELKNPAFTSTGLDAPILTAFVDGWKQGLELSGVKNPTVN